MAQERNHVKKPSEQELIDAALALGQATTACSPEEREEIKGLYQKVFSFSETQKAKGILIDRSAFFAAGLVLHPLIQNPSVQEAAVKYIELDLLFVRESPAADLCSS